MEEAWAEEIWETDDRREGNIMSLIELKNIQKIYGENMENEVRALNNVSLSIDRGEFVTIVGTSGSGKSTMMNILGCLDIPTYGEYLLDGISVGSLNEKQLSNIRGRKIGFIFQGYNLVASQRVWENVALPLAYQGVSAGERYERAMDALEKVGISDKSECYPGKMSGGQQQRVAIARAIATRAPIIMADEPTGALDSKNSTQVIELLKEINAGGTTVILITHDNNIAALARRIVRITDGKIVSDNINLQNAAAGVN